MRRAYAMNEYPRHRTIVGNFEHDQTFTISRYQAILDIDRWDEAPLDWGEGVIPFVLYVNGEFHCWAFVYDRIYGYCTRDDTDDYQLMIKIPDSNTFKFIDPLSDMIIVAKENDYESFIAALAQHLPAHFKYEAVFFTYDAIKNFCYKLMKNGIIEK